MAEDKPPSVPVKQKEDNKETLWNKTWNAGEVERFSPATRLSLVKKLRLQVSNSYLDTKDRFYESVIHEIETGLSFNLTPVFLGIGILIYFSIPNEPSILALGITVCVLAYALWRLKLHSKVSIFSSMLAVVISGMFVAQVATRINQTPMLERQITTKMQAVILSVDSSRRGAARYLVRPINLEGLEAKQLPNRIRVSASAKHNIMLPGNVISGLVRLQPISGPVYPGGYDFSFFAWHEGLGASGFFMGKPEQLNIKNSTSWIEKFTIQINRKRIAVEKRIIKAMPDETGKIAVALVTGNKTGIPEDIQESLRKTGLAHILAISGLHMALVTLTVIWCIRYILAFIPSIALRYPIKKWAVCAGFISATTYLMLSGAGIATQRAWVMISVMLLAVLMDRRAITIRSVAISAIIILVLNPQSLLSPGFQMSFAAVTALVAGYEAINKRRKARAENTFVPIQQNRFFKTINGVLLYFGGIATTSLIAGTATAFIAAWHFHQVASFGLLANLIAMPVVSILIMPFVLFSILLMPYGLEFIPLISVSYGIEQVVSVSQWVETISPNGNTGLLPRSTIFLFAGFLITICFFKTKLRMLSLIPLGLLPWFFNYPIIPDVIIAENGRAVAIKTEVNKLGLVFPRGSAFVQNIWLKAWSGGKTEKLGLSKEQCNRERCIIVLPSSKVLHIVYNPDLLNSSCNRADILIAPRLWWVNCKQRKPELILKRYDFERFGTHALYMNKVKPNAKIESNILNSKIPIQEIVVTTALPKASRPWHRYVTHPDER